MKFIVDPKIGYAVGISGKGMHGLTESEILALVKFNLSVCLAAKPRKAKSSQSQVGGDK